MPRRPNAKKLDQAKVRFKSALTAYIISEGAQPSDFYEYEIATPAGRLWITIYETWIACRFDDVELGKRFTESCGSSCNPYTGKWNFHFSEGTVESLDPEMAIAHFGFFLGQLICWEPHAAV